MVVGGVPRCDESGTHIRGEIHMLLIGDPGTGGGLGFFQARGVWWALGALVGGLVVGERCRERVQYSAAAA